MVLDVPRLRRPDTRLEMATVEAESVRTVNPQPETKRLAEAHRVYQIALEYQRAIYDEDSLEELDDAREAMYQPWADHICAQIDWEAWQ